MKTTKKEEIDIVSIFASMIIFWSVFALNLYNIIIGPDNVIIIKTTFWTPKPSLLSNLLVGGTIVVCLVIILLRSKTDTNRRVEAGSKWNEP